LGTTTGGMRVRVDGIGLDGRPRRAVWTLVAQRGDGPLIPAMPAVALALAILRGRPPEPGARPCMGEIGLPEIADLLAGHAIAAQLETDRPTSFYRRVLGDDLDRVPAPVRAVHELSHDTTLSGAGTVEHGESVIVRLATRLGMLPAEGTEIPVSVHVALAPGQERWQRSFDGHAETSLLHRPGPGRFEERYGPLTVRLEVTAGTQGIDLRIGRNRLLGLPLPGWLGLRGHATERVDPLGHFSFDVAIDLPFRRRLIRYRGWLA
ncbi:MAG: DUF4166 domain-containing protein, partial [Proteobacteria bacterium]|nr:DUF4166 domain-containing protein [Pseudomonadota bacterium]